MDIVGVVDTFLAFFVGFYLKGTVHVYLKEYCTAKAKIEKEESKTTSQQCLIAFQSSEHIKQCMRNRKY